MIFTPDQKIVIQGFGLGNLTPANLVSQGVYAGTISALNAKSKIVSSQNPYAGKIPQGQPEDTPIGTSVLGTPVWDTLEILGDTYTDPETGFETSYGKLRLDNCLITVTREKKIVITDVQGKNGEVIEYISSNSYRINIKGGIFGQYNNVRPVDEINNFNTMLSSNKVITISQCNYLVNEFGITEMVVLHEDHPQLPGGRSYQLFEFNCIQSTPIILAQRNA